MHGGRHAPRPSPAGAKRGLLSERAWADVRRAARLAHEEKVTIRLHGLVVTAKLKQSGVSEKVVPEDPKLPVEAAGRTTSSAMAGDAPPSSGGKRTKRNAQRLQEFQEKKRAAFVAELTAKGCELRHAQEAVASAEQQRLERIARKRAQPMEADAAPGQAMEADAAPGQPMEADAAPGLGVCPAGTPPALPAR